MLAIDLGNSTIAVARYTDGLLTGRLTHALTDATSSSLVAAMQDTGCLPDDDEAVVIASVVPAKNSLLAETFIQPVRFLTPDGIIKNRLSGITSTGVDRLLAARAAVDTHLSDNGVVVVQAGTALTVDFVNGEGVFEGGWIMPGPRMWLDSLSTAAKLPALSAADIATTTHLGKNTNEAILGGAAIGISGAVEKAISLCRNQPPIIITGGWGNIVREWLSVRTDYVPDLVLQGIYLVAAE